MQQEKIDELVKTIYLFHKLKNNKHFYTYINTFDILLAQSSYSPPWRCFKNREKTRPAAKIIGSTGFLTLSFLSN